MKKPITLTLAILTIILVLVTLTACGKENNAPEADFSLKIDDVFYGPETFAELDAVTLTLTRFGRDGEETLECTGFRLQDILAAAGHQSGRSLVLSADDGFYASLSAEQADAATTLLAVSEGGETLPDSQRPMLTVDGEGGNFWVRGVTSISEEDLP